MCVCVCVYLFFIHRESGPVIGSRNSDVIYNRTKINLSI